MVLFKVDAEVHKDLTERYQVHGYPTFVLANTAGESIDRWMGYKKADFTQMLELALADPTTIDEKKARFAKAPTSRDAETLGRFTASRGEHQRAVGYYQKAAELEPDQDFAYEIFDAIFSGSRSDEPVYTAEERTKAADAVLASKHASPDEVVHVAKMMTGAARKAGDVSAAAPYLAAAMEHAANADDERTQKIREGLLPLHAMHVEKDPQKALILKRGLMKDGWLEDAGELNNFAWWCFENNVNLEAAKEKAHRGVELAADDHQRAMILDTEAEICNAVDNCEEAVSLMKQAIAADPDNDYYKEQLARFEERLATLVGEAADKN